MDNRIARETAIVKIAYEYAYEHLGRDYLNDRMAKIIRRCLNLAIQGDYSLPFPYIQSIEYGEDTDACLLKVRKKYGCVHQIGLERYNNMLAVSVYLFSIPKFSYIIFISMDANLYDQEILPDHNIIFPKTGNMIQVSTIPFSFEH